MAKMKSPVISLALRNWYRIITSVIIILSIVVRLHNINSQLLDTHYFRQTQTATVARNYFKNGIDLLHPTLDIFGTRKEKVLVLEFPFYQAMVASLANFLGYSDSLGKIISIFFGISSGVILMLLATYLTNNKFIGLFSLILFLFMPLNIFFQQAFMIESTVVALHIFSLYCWLKYLKRKKNFWFILAIILTSLAFLQKSIYAPFLIPPILALIYINKSKTRLDFPKLLLGLIIPILILIIWQRYADLTNSTNGNAFFTSSNSHQLLWNFGTIGDRVSVSLWTFRIKTLIDSITKFNLFLFLIGFLSLIKSDKKERIVFLAWLGSMAAYFFIFFRIQSHNYYSLITLPIISIFASYGLFNIYPLINRLVQSKITALRLYLIFTFLFFALFIFKGWRNSLPYFWIDLNTQKELAFLSSTLTEPGQIIFVLDQKDWNSAYTYYTHRIGTIAVPAEVTSSSIAEFRSNNYKYLVLYNILSDSKEKSLLEVIRNLTMIGTYKNIIVYRL